MIESIKDPFETFQVLAARTLGARFKRDGANYVADGRNERGLKVQVTLHQDGSLCQVLFAEQESADYDAVVYKDVALVSLTRKGARELKDFLEMHGATLASGPESAQ